MRICKAKLTKLCKGQFVYPSVNTAHSAEGCIMEDNRDPVGGKLDVQFNSVSGIYCSLKGGKGVFGNLMVIIMQPPVGKKCAEKGGAVCAADSGVHQKHIQRGEADEDL